MTDNIVKQVFYKGNILLPEEVLKNYRKAGRIARDVRNKAHKLVDVGTSVLDICEKLENMIRDKGGKLAFPINICINDVAAHYSPPPMEVKTIPAGSIVKVDVGVHINGYIADTATSIGLSVEHEDMIRTAEKCLEKAIKTIRPGVKASDVGDAVEKIIKRYGFKPIWNLTGHQLARFMLHTGKSIPNVSRINGSKLDEGDVYAIEPFITLPQAAGEVKSTNDAYIYRLHKERSMKDEKAKKLMKTIKTNFRNLPFSPRWIVDELPRRDFDQAFSKLLASKNVVGYPVLVEKSSSIVAQAEHTVIVTRDGCEVTTA